VTAPVHSEEPAFGVATSGRAIAEGYLKVCVAAGKVATDAYWETYAAVATDLLCGFWAKDLDYDGFIKQLWRLGDFMRGVRDGAP